MGSMFKGSGKPDPTPAPVRNPMETADQFKTRRKQFRNPIGRANSILGGGDDSDGGATAAAADAAAAGNTL